MTYLHTFSKNSEALSRKGTTLFNISSDLETSFLLCKIESTENSTTFAQQHKSINQTMQLDLLKAATPKSKPNHRLVRELSKLLHEFGVSHELKYPRTDAQIILQCVHGFTPSVTVIKSKPFEADSYLSVEVFNSLIKCNGSNFLRVDIHANNPIDAMAKLVKMNVLKKGGSNV